MDRVVTEGLLAHVGAIHRRADTALDAEDTEDTQVRHLSEASTHHNATKSRMRILINTYFTFIA